MTICLSMIVKNEAHCISKCLNSVKNIIDYWVISDTGSTDNTESVVKTILKDIPGEYHKNKWVDFSTNRNISLNIAKQKADYILIIDADDYLILENYLPDLKDEAYKIEIKHGSISYHRIQLISSKIQSKYCGVVHEYLDIGNISPKILDGCYMVFGGNGNRSKDPKKYLNDALLLEKNLNTPRDYFYCAQSYRDAGNLDNAFYYYNKRIVMGGWVEEIYYSLLQLTKIAIKQNKQQSDIDFFAIKAFNLLPTRNETLVYLSGYYREKNSFDKAYFFSNIAKNINKPNEGLFLEDACYDWKALDEFAIASYYIGKKKEAEIANKNLLNSNKLPIEQIKRVKENLNFCLR